MAQESGLLEIATEVRMCERCPLHATRANAVPGEGPADARVMIVGEGPGKSEDQLGLPFVGSAGRNLDELLSVAGLKRDAVFVTNCVKCRPPANRRPSRAETDACYPYLRRQIELVSPEVIVLLGDTALRQFFPQGKLGAMHGRLARRAGRPFYPTYHPAAMMYNRSLKGVLEKDFANMRAALRTLRG